MDEQREKIRRAIATLAVICEDAGFRCIVAACNGDGADWDTYVSGPVIISRGLLDTLSEAVEEYAAENVIVAPEPSGSVQ